MDEALLVKARDYATQGQGSGMIIRHGRLAFWWGDLRQRYDLKSTTKSFGAAAVGLALLDGKLKSLGDKALMYHSALGQGADANAPPGWLEKITIEHLLTHTAGFDKPGGTAKLLFEPGTRWAYSDSAPNWLAECLSLAYKRDLDEMMFERLFEPIGIKRSDLTWRANAYRPRKIEGVERREFGSGIHANVDAMARFGYLFLRKGLWQDKQLLPADFVEACGKPARILRGVPTADQKTYGRASEHYGYLWWNNGDRALKDVPEDAFWSWGLYDSLIVVIPSLDIVLARAGKSLREEGGGHYDKLAPLLGPIAKSVKRQQQ